MKKKVVFLFIVVVMIFGLGGCFFDEESDASKFKEEYESLNGKTSSSGKPYPEVSIDSDNKIKYASLEDVLDILNGGTGVIYFGYPQCPWCRNAVPVLLQAAFSTDLGYVYYVNMYDERDTMEINSEGEVVTTKEASSDYYELLEALDSILLDYTIEDDSGSEVSLGEKRIYVPLVVFVLNGEIVDYHADTVSSQENPYVTLTEEQQEELFQIYVSGIHKVLQDICDEGEEHC